MGQYPCRHCGSTNLKHIRDEWEPIYKHTQYGRQQVGDNLLYVFECGECKQVFTASFEEILMDEIRRKGGA
jgi:hypothetical protein